MHILCNVSCTSVYGHHFSNFKPSAELKLEVMRPAWFDRIFWARLIWKEYQCGNTTCLVILLLNILQESSFTHLNAIRVQRSELTWKLERKFCKNFETVGAIAQWNSWSTGIPSKIQSSLSRNYALIQFCVNLMICTRTINRSALFLSERRFRKSKALDVWNEVDVTGLAKAAHAYTCFRFALPLLYSKY